MCLPQKINKWVYQTQLWGKSGLASKRQSDEMRKTYLSGMVSAIATVIFRLIPH